MSPMAILTNRLTDKQLSIVTYTNVPHSAGPCLPLPSPTLQQLQYDHTWLLSSVQTSHSAGVMMDIWGIHVYITNNCIYTKVVVKHV